MAERVILHIGAMKSGTKFVQRSLGTNKSSLGAQGMLFPGADWQAQVLAVSEVLERSKPGPVDRTGAWQRLIDEIRAWPHDAVVSMEFLASATPRKIRTVVSAFEDTRLEIVLTARDLNRSIPSMWQEVLKNGKSSTWEDYRSSIESGHEDGKPFWRQQNWAAISKKWSGVVGADRFTLVTVPPPGNPPTLLWERFCSAIGVSSAEFTMPPPMNESLGAASALVLRELNERLQQRDVGWIEYARIVKRGLSKKVLASRRREEQPVGLEVTPFVRRRTEEMLAGLGELDIRVVGDLADLQPVPVEGVDPSTVSVDERLDAALAGMAGLIEREAQRSAAD